ncbi:hypothetical protein GCM10011346_50630 [Oceanobacillus neutriphilus]|uniref:Uncharacterized protein n=1 Tax=Oceanobacillus neutriphilus TaxID=531815 RepID=A0ABQ2P368_9BACI|nr:hypothetical protein GCM10011346_50630 [Oceanobacillus neutriphilus]
MSHNNWYRLGFEEIEYINSKVNKNAWETGFFLIAHSNETTPCCGLNNYSLLYRARMLINRFSRYGRYYLC